MIKRFFGNTDMTISVIGLGTWAIGEWMWGEQCKKDSIEAIHSAINSGINWIDTAPIYGSGLSESMVGEALSQIPSSKKPYVFTKFGLGDNSNIRKPSASYDEVISECENSLKRLKTDCIDLYQLHWPVEQEIEETAKACEKLQKDGKIKLIGVSNFSINQLNEWKKTGIQLNSLQSPYNILRLEAEKELIPWCLKEQIACIAYSPLFRGLLFGAWDKEKTFHKNDARSAHPDYQGKRFIANLNAIEKIKKVAEEHDMNCAELCIGILLCCEGLTACIVGARNAKQGELLGELGMPAKTSAIKKVTGILYDLEKETAVL